jgi:GNAT superfamily N-acetyltransferase
MRIARCSWYRGRHEPEHRRRPIELCDGSRVRIRQGHRTDRDPLVQVFEHLSPESRYRRFLTPMLELDDAALRFLTAIDHHDHEALIALDEAGTGAVGVARYVRYPERPGVAEVAVTVVDDWQGRGLGTLLLQVISARARGEGVRIFTAQMLASNGEMMHLLRELGAVRIVDRAAGVLEVEVAIPAIGVAPTLSEMLRMAA